MDVLNRQLYTLKLSNNLKENPKNIKNIYTLETWTGFGTNSKLINTLMYILE